MDMMKKTLAENLPSLGLTLDDAIQDQLCACYLIANNGVFVRVFPAFLMNGNNFPGDFFAGLISHISKIIFCGWV